MGPLEVGVTAPEIPSVAFAEGPVGLFFYKVTCPTCRLAAPVMAAFERAYPGRVVGIGQDPPEALDDFARELGMGIGSLSDLPPYDVSNAYGVVSVPTLFLVDAGGTVLESVGAWDREGFNRVSRRLAELIGAAAVVVSDPSDGLPAFKPG